MNTINIKKILTLITVTFLTICATSAYIGGHKSGKPELSEYERDFDVTIIEDKIINFKKK